MSVTIIGGLRGTTQRKLWRERTVPCVGGGLRRSTLQPLREVVALFEETSLGVEVDRLAVHDQTPALVSSGAESQASFSLARWRHS